VHDSLPVKVAQGQGNLNGIEFNFLLLETATGLEEPIEFTSPDKRHDKEQSQLRHK